MIDLLEGKFFQTFLAVYEEGSINSAAKRLGYVQSTVSTHIQLLEDICDQKLFHRLSSGVQPTDAGIKLKQYAYQFLHLGTSLKEAMNNLEQPVGTIHISMPESFFLTRMTPFFKKFLKQYPDIKVKLQTGYQQDILNSVLDHQVDFGIVPANPRNKKVTFQPLMEEKLIFIASPNLAMEINRHGMDLLREEMLISYGTNCIYYHEAKKVLHKIVEESENKMELPSIELIKQSVHCGIGYALIPKVAVQEEIREGTFVQLPIDQPLLFTHGLIHRRDREKGYAIKLFEKQLIHFFTEANSEQPPIQNVFKKGKNTKEIMKH